MKKFLLIVLIIMIIPKPRIFAEDIRKVGTTAAVFLRIPVGSRATAMGGAFVSMKPDVSSLYWNPSNIGGLQNIEIIVDYSNWLVGLDHSFLGIVVPVEGFGSVGLSATMLQTDEMDVTTPREPMGTGETFKASSIALGLTYANQLTDKFIIGGSVKYVSESIYNSHATGVAFDIGTIYETPFSGIRLGASISNFGTKMQMTGEDLNVRVDIAPNQEGNNQSVVGLLKTDEFALPLIMRLGVSGEVVNSEMLRVTLAADGINPNDNSQSLNVGGEIGLINELVLLRAGYTGLFLPDNEKGVSFGIGINEFNLLGSFWLTADFAFQQMKYLGSINRFSVKIKI